MKFHPYIEQHRSHFEEAETKYGLKPGLLMAIAQQETGWSRAPDLAKLTSPVGAQGLMQFMPATAKDFNIDPRDPIQAIDGAGRYFQRLGKLFDNDLEKMIASYNAGEGAVMDYMNGTNKTKKNPKLRSGTFPPFQENIKYRRNVLNMLGEQITPETIKQAEQLVGKTLTRFKEPTAPPAASGELVSQQVTDPSLQALEASLANQVTSLATNLPKPLGLDPFEPLNAAPKDPYEILRKRVEEQRIIEEEKESPSFSSQHVAGLRSGLSYRAAISIEEQAARTLSEDKPFMSYIRSTEGVDNTKLFLTNVAKMHEEDPRLAGLLESISESRNPVEYDMKLQHAKEALENEEVMAKTYGINSNLGSLFSGQGLKGFRKKDVLADVAVLLTSPENYIGVGITSKVLGSVGTTMLARAAARAGYAGKVLKGAAAAESTLAHLSEKTPLAVKALIGASIAGELTALGTAPEALSPAGTTEERMQQSAMIAGGFGLFFGTIGAGGASASIRAMAKSRLEKLRQQRKAEGSFGGAEEMATSDREEYVQKTRGQSRQEYMEESTRQSILVQQVAEEIGKLADNTEVTLAERLGAQTKLYDALPPMDKFLYLEQFKEIARYSPRMKEFVDHIETHKPEDALPVRLEENPAIAKGAAIQEGLTQKRKTYKVFPVGSAFSVTRNVDEQIFADTFTERVAKANNLTREELAEATPVLRAGMQHFGPLLSMNHYVYGKLRDVPGESASVAKAFSVAFLGESAGLLRSATRDIPIASTGILHTAEKRSQNLIKNVRGAIMPDIKKYMLLTGRTQKEAIADLNSFSLGVPAKLGDEGPDVLKTTEQANAILEGITQKYSALYADMLDRMYTKGLIPTEAYDRMKEASAKQPWLPRAFSIEGVNKLLISKGLTEKDLNKLIKEASLSYFHKSGKFSTQLSDPSSQESAVMSSLKGAATYEMDRINTTIESLTQQLEEVRASVGSPLTKDLPEGAVDYVEHFAQSLEEELSGLLAQKSIVEGRLNELNAIVEDLPKPVETLEELLPPVATEEPSAISEELKEAEKRLSDAIESQKYDAKKRRAAVKESEDAVKKSGGGTFFQDVTNRIEETEKQIDRTKRQLSQMIYPYLPGKKAKSAAQSAKEQQALQGLVDKQNAIQEELSANKSLLTILEGDFNTKTYPIQDGTKVVYKGYFYDPSAKSGLSFKDVNSVFPIGEAPSWVPLKDYLESVRLTDPAKYGDSLDEMLYKGLYPLNTQLSEHETKVVKALTKDYLRIDPIKEKIAALQKEGQKAGKQYREKLSKAESSQTTLTTEEAFTKMLKKATAQKEQGFEQIEQQRADLQKTVVPLRKKIKEYLALLQRMDEANEDYLEGLERDEVVLLVYDVARQALKAQKELSKLELFSSAGFKIEVDVTKGVDVDKVPEGELRDITSALNALAEDMKSLHGYTLELKAEQGLLQAHEYVITGFNISEAARAKDDVRTIKALQKEIEALKEVNKPQPEAPVKALEPTESAAKEAVFSPEDDLLEKELTELTDYLNSLEQQIGGLAEQKRLVAEELQKSNEARQEAADTFTGEYDIEALEKELDAAYFEKDIYEEAGKIVGKLDTDALAFSPPQTLALLEDIFRLQHEIYEAAKFQDKERYFDLSTLLSAKVDQIIDFDRAIKDTATNGATKYMEKLRDLYYRNRGIETEFNMLSKEDFSKLIEEMQKTIDENIGGRITEKDAKDVRKALLESMYIYTDKTNQGLLDSLVHRAPLDTTYSKSFPNGQTLSVADIYGTKNFLMTTEGSLRSIEGTLALAEGTGIHKASQIDALLNEATIGISDPKAAKDVRKFMEIVLNKTRGLPVTEKSPITDITGAFQAYTYLNYGAYFPVTQAAETAQIALTHPISTTKAAVKRLFGDHGKAQEHLVTILNAMNNKNMPSSGAIVRQMHEIANDMTNAFIHEQPTRDFSEAVSPVDKAYIGAQKGALIASRINLHALSRIASWQKNAYLKIALIDMEEMAEKILPQRDAILNTIKTRFPDVYQENSAFLENYIVKDSAMADVIEEAYPNAAAELMPLLDKLTLKKSNTFYLFTELGLPHEGVLEALRTAKALRDNADVDPHAATRLFTALDNFSGSMVYNPTTANMPKFVMEHPVMNLVFGLMRFAFESWNTITHRLLAHPAETVLWGALFSSMVVSYIQQEMMLLVSSYLPATLAGAVTGDANRAIEHYSQAREELMMPKKDDPGIMGYSTNFVLGILMRSAALSYMTFLYRTGAYVNRHLPQPEFIRASNLPNKGFIESMPWFNAVTDPITSAVGVGRIVAEGATQQNVREVVSHAPLMNSFAPLKIFLQSILHSEWYEELPKKAQSTK